MHHDSAPIPPPSNVDTLLLAAALADMPREECRILRLHHERGLDFEAIGGLLGLDPELVRARWARGLKRLRRSCRRAGIESPWGRPGAVPDKT